MSGWESSDRKHRLPKNWTALRGRILLRDHYRCSETLVDGQRCPAPATDVDHINPGDDHHPANLRSLCAWHHARKSSAEGNAKKKRFSKKRAEEKHPGMR